MLLLQALPLSFYALMQVNKRGGKPVIILSCYIDIGDSTTYVTTTQSLDQDSVFRRVDQLYALSGKYTVRNPRRFGQEIPAFYGVTLNQPGFPSCFIEVPFKICRDF